MIRQFFIFFIKIYQYIISPLLGNSCRFYPTCSNYMMTSIERFGVIKGFWMGFKRLSKCHPFHEGGCDPVPELSKNQSKNHLH